MQKIELQFKNKESIADLDRELFDSYWANTDFKFNYDVKEINEKYQIDTKSLISKISVVEAFLNFGNCSACNHQNLEIVKNRTRVKQVIENLYYHYFCNVCRNKAKEFCKNKSEYDSKIVWMKLALKYRLWEKLNNEELSFLKTIYHFRDWNRLYHELIKLDINYYFQILFKLDKINLIFYNKDLITGQVKIKMLQDLENLIQEKKI